MILLYHKVDPENKTPWWVSADKFYKQMKQLSGKKVVYLDQYDPSNPDHVVITFDGIYTNVLRYAVPVLEKFDYPYELFITSDYLGKDNIFDDPEPPCSFLDETALKKLTTRGGRIQWHTKSHADLTKVSDSQLKIELLPPKKLLSLDPKGFKWFAYPYGKFDERCQKIIKKNFNGGLACENGTYDDITIWPRKIVYEETSLIQEKVSVIITSYNYGHFLTEAIDTVLAQTYLPDEILLSDDASTDHSYEIMKEYQNRYPDLIKLNRNKTNLGIENHFNKAVSLTTGEFICFLGADNRLPSGYIENCVEQLLKNKASAVVYTDFALFGNRAEVMYEKFNPKYRAAKLDYGVYIIEFPKFTPETKKHLLTEGNFIHGSSMYRRAAFDQVGGYKSRAEGHEDYALFQAMVKKGWDATKVEKTYLEYRQHSSEQANQQFVYFGELAFLREYFKKNSERVEALEKEIKEVHKQLGLYQEHAGELERKLSDIYKSKFWKLRKPYVVTAGMVKRPRQTTKMVASKTLAKIKNKRSIKNK